VVKRFPDRLSIYLEPRQAVALSLAKLEGRLLPLYYDRHGVVFMAGSGVGEKMTSNIPVISGLNFENPVLGMRLPDSLKPLLENLEKINRSAPELLAAVSEIEIRAKPFDGFDLVLYPLHSPIRVRLENTMNEDTLRYVMLLLDVFKSRSSIPEEIDFRSGMGSYKVKEAPSGE
jgi:cell division protein FtsQ